MGFFGKRRLGVVLHAENSTCLKGTPGAGSDDSVDASVNNDGASDASFLTLIHSSAVAPCAGTTVTRSSLPSCKMLLFHRNFLLYALCSQLHSARLFCERND